MTKIRTLQLYRGTEAQNDAYTGSIGELTMDTTNNELRIHDGSTAGGHKIGGGGSVDIDNSTITKNSDDELQAVATINANTAVGATNPVYDWVGTLAEYTSQAVATNHPEWVCYITDDVSGGASVYDKTEVDILLANKVNVGHEVIDFQEPTALNNYTWYRKYDDGWVEQGGQTASATQSTTHAIVLPVEMANANYFVCLTQTVATNGYIIRATDRTTTGFNIKSDYFTASANPSGVKLWQVSGMAA